MSESRNVPPAGAGEGASTVVLAAAAAAARVATPIEGLNPLARAAYPLLEVAGLLRHASAPMHIEALREQLCEMVTAFVEQAGQAGASADTIEAAQYCLCTCVDESVAGTPWGAAGGWANRSLLLSFHGERSGGARFFSILEQLLRDPRANIDALELLHLILAQGMTGLYRLAPDGARELDAIRDRLWDTIVAQRGASEGALSPHWRALTDGTRAWWQGRGLLSVALAATCMLGALYFVYAQLLAVRVDEAIYRLTLTHPPVIRAHAAEARPADRPALADLLTADVAQGRVSIDKQADRTVLTLPSDGLFASGSASVLDGQMALVRRIGDALKQVPGQVVVLGYTDDRRPAAGATTNAQLSLLRAGQVVEILRTRAGQPDRFLAQGRGESDPVAPNDNAEDRARNRRVAIVVLDSAIRLAPAAPPFSRFDSR